MSKNFENVKGTYDYLPEKQITRERIKSILQGIFVKYGFAPIETPILCTYDLLASKYSEGADILNEMYTLSDRGKRNLGLRYDLTITFSKLISSNSGIMLPFKRYEIGKVFRDGPVKVGRMREFTQCDVDVVGVKSMMAEAEYMEMTCEGYKSLGLDIEIEFNNRKLLSGIIQCVFGNVSEDDLRKIIMLVDKFAKLTDDELVAEFEAILYSKEQVQKLKEILQSDFDGIKELTNKYENKLINEGISEIEELYSYVDQNTEQHMKFAPYLARGIDIYTGTVWEVFLKNRNVNGQDFNISLGGGGRFDKIITTFIDDGNEYPAVGMSFGLDVIYEVMSRMEDGKKVSSIDLFVIPMGTKTESFKFVSQMRKAGVRCDIEKQSQRLKKSMKYANSINVPYVVIIGDNEVELGTIRLRNMSDGSEQEFALDNYNGIKQTIVG